MAATVKRNIELYATADGKPASVVRGKIAATQGILIPNSLLYLSTSGTWKAADTSDGSGDVVHGLLVGLDDSSATWPITAALAGNTVIKVQLIDADDLYAVYVENAGTDAAMSEAYKGIEYGLTISTTPGQVGYATLNIANSNDTVSVVEAMANVETAKAAAADSPGVAIVKFLAAAIEAEKA
jgi:hypothetical protein